jgi:hypothetical protein
MVLEKLLTAVEAAAVLRVRPQLLAKWRHYGRGPAYLKPAKAILYRLEDLDAWLAGTRREPDRRAQPLRTARRSQAGARKGASLLTTISKQDEV